MLAVAPEARPAGNAQTPVPDVNVPKLFEALEYVRPAGNPTVYVRPVAVLGPLFVTDMV